MRRSRLLNLLHDYVAGDLDGDARVEVERLVVSDPKARVLLDDVRAAHDALCTLRERPEPPVRAEDAMPRIQAAIATASFEPRPKLHLEGQGTRFYRRAALAATLLLGVSVGLFAVQATRPEAPGPQAPPAPVADVAPTEPLPAVSFVDVGPNGIPADEFFRLIEENGLDPRELEVTPLNNVVPISSGPDEDR